MRATDENARNDDELEAKYLVAVMSFERISVCVERWLAQVVLNIATSLPSEQRVEGLGGCRSQMFG